MRVSARARVRARVRVWARVRARARVWVWVRACASLMRMTKTPRWCGDSVVTHFQEYTTFQTL